jgi:hypothetical protein
MVFYWGGVRLGQRGTSTTIYPIVPGPDDKRMVSVEQSVELEFAGETGVFGENLPQCHFIHHKCHMT